MPEFRGLPSDLISIEAERDRDRERESWLNERDRERDLSSGERERESIRSPDPFLLVSAFERVTGERLRERESDLARDRPLLEDEAALPSSPPARSERDVFAGGLFERDRDRDLERSSDSERERRRDSFGDRDRERERLGDRERDFDTARLCDRERDRLRRDLSSCNRMRRPCNSFPSNLSNAAFISE
ncbi:hypothetical protein RDWZM_008774 [Blomia tropicalis]|uniref:Uncharacterized protein n=1 Tax=Blomia tropicalis TaxID=40697 RepID=A0A9Q0M494_BLOTA|nr:hypothetical protein RDWZM_008774 [Blomia tropicalis]